MEKHLNYKIDFKKFFFTELTWLQNSVNVSWQRLAPIETTFENVKKQKQNFSY